MPSSRQTSASARPPRSWNERARIRVEEACWCPYAGLEVPECDGGPEFGRQPGWPSWWRAVRRREGRPGLREGAAVRQSRRGVRRLAPPPVRPPPPPPPPPRPRGPPEGVPPRTPPAPAPG